MEFSIKGNSPYNHWFTMNFEEFTWYHLAVTYSKAGKYAKLYVNGKLEEQRTYKKATSPKLDDFEMGAWNKQRYFKGMISDLRIWNKVRTEDQIRENMVKLSDANDKSLIGRWQLNEGKGKVALDTSANDNTGVFGGELAWTAECVEKE